MALQGHSTPDACVRYSFSFPSDVEVPGAVRARAKEILLDVAKSLDGIPATTGYWTAMNDGFAELNLAGWRFEYRIDPGRNLIRVVTVQPIAHESG